jgi:DNA-binding IclR family transcriptional regulator
MASTGQEEAVVDMARTELKHIAANRNGRDGPAPGVIESAFGLMELLCALGRARVAELAEESGLPRTTVHRLLGQLAAVGAVERIGAHYRLAAGLLILGRHVTPMERLRTLAQRPLIELAAGTPAHVYLGAATSGAPIYLDTFSGPKRLPFQLTAGDRMPARSAGTRALTTGVEFAVDDADTMAGVSCAARAIVLPDGMAAVGIIVPRAHLPRSLLGPLRATAHRISALLAALTPGAVHGPGNIWPGEMACNCLTQQTV